MGDVLEAHVLTVHDGGRRFALVVLDVVCVNVDLARAVEISLRSLGVDDAWVCATHTHSGPETGCVPGGSPTPAPWGDVIATAARRAARDAVAGEVDAVVGASVVSVPDVASVRSTPGAAVAVPVDVVAFRHQGAVAGVLVVLPVHPTVLPATNNDVSADLTGAVRRAVADRVGGWAIVATGAAGDISTRGVRQGTDLAECARLGNLVADRVAGALPQEFGGGAVRSARHDTRVVPAEPPAVSVAVGDSRQAETLRQAHRLRDALDWPDAPLRATVRAALLGSVGLVGVPGEPFLDLRSRVDGILLGYVGGYLGYLPTETAFAGEASYETVISPIAPGEAECLVDAAADELARLRLT